MVVAEKAKEKGVLSAGVFSLPFSFEGKTRYFTSQEGLKNLLGILDFVVLFK